MKILVTNDDGFQSPYLEILWKALAPRHNLFLVCPKTEQSGIAQAISMYRSLRYEELPELPFPGYMVDGTPSDCIKLAVCHLFTQEKFDLVLSGINPGENAGLNALYSGTVAGAREGATWGIPSIALSIWDGDVGKAHHAARWIGNLIEEKKILPGEGGTFWNINFPRCAPDEIAGTSIGRMGMSEFKDRYQEYVTPRGYSEFWLDGYKHPDEFTPESDDIALFENKIAITPLTIDQTSQVERERLMKLENLT